MPCYKRYHHLTQRRLYLWSSCSMCWSRFPFSPIRLSWCIWISAKSWRPLEPITEPSQFRNTVHVCPFPLSVKGAPTMGDNRYGTRLSSILLIKKNGEALFIERDIWTLVDEKVVRADPKSQRVFRFQVMKPIKPWRKITYNTIITIQ